MTRTTAPLGSREDRGPAPSPRRILAVPRPGWPRYEEDVMADLAYALLLVGGFAVLALTLRGLQRL
jgi:hypothetical protein